MLLFAARTSVNESRSTRTALLHAILPDPIGETPLKAKICHCSLIRWKTIRKYVKCAQKHTGVRCEGFERLPVRSAQHSEGSGFQQLTRRGEKPVSAGEAINFDYLKSSSTSVWLIFSSLSFYGSVLKGIVWNEGWKSTGSNWTGLWDYWADYRTIIGQKSQTLLSTKGWNWSISPLCILLVLFYSTL